MRWKTSSFFAHSLILGSALTEASSQCKKTTVAILGAGTTGITAAQTLSRHSIEDYLIVEYNDEIGGRVKHTNFGKKSDGTPYVVELGANWIQGLEKKGGHVNPIWTLCKRYNVQNTYSNYSSILTYNDQGKADYGHLFNEFDRAYSKFEQRAGYILTENLQDRSAKAGLELAGWNPKTPGAQAVDWFEMDFEYAWPPAETSMLWATINYNTTFYRYSDRNNYVFDQRGYNTFIKGEAATFLAENDPRLLFNTIVTDISYSDDSVTIHNADGTCITADYALCTFSIGVLQQTIAARESAKEEETAPLTFHPSLPEWKQESLAMFQMGTYTKIFLQFPPEKQFWPEETQYFLYSSIERGYYPIWQSLSAPGFLPGSGILFVTVVEPQSPKVDAQDDETTKQQVMEVLYQMFGKDNVPDPIAFMYPRWSKVPWARGSYSNWPLGTSLEMHENLRASVGRLWFAGEATSAPYFGFLQGAYTEGRHAGRMLSSCILNQTECAGDQHYRVLHGPTPYDEYDKENGMYISTFYPE